METVKEAVWNHAPRNLTCIQKKRKKKLSYGGCDSWPGCVATGGFWHVTVIFLLLLLPSLIFSLVIMCASQNSAHTFHTVSQTPLPRRRPIPDTRLDTSETSPRGKDGRSRQSYPKGCQVRHKAEGCAHLVRLMAIFPFHNTPPGWFSKCSAGFSVPRKADKPISLGLVRRQAITISGLLWQRRAARTIPLSTSAPSFLPSHAEVWRLLHSMQYEPANSCQIAKKAS